MRPRLFSRPFVERIAAGLSAGYVSVKKAALLMDVSVEGLAEVLRGYGVEPEFEA